jgi:hypothetical protein
VSLMASRNNNPKARGTELVVQELKDEVLIYDLNINKTYCLNPTSAIIWNLCDGNNSVSDITNQLSKQLKQPVTDDLVYLALDQFKEENLLLDNQTVEIKFDGLSRREVIRKVGFASLIALPVISSLVAPTAAMAASGAAVCRTSNQSCSPTSALGNCCSGLFCSTSAQCNTCRPTDDQITLCLGEGFDCNTVEYQCCSGSASFDVRDMVVGCGPPQFFGAPRLGRCVCD